ncbi:MAG: alpha,alpha-trehalase TreF [Marinilabiliaceae bacterium]|nr:alpha,alpha-trehalase TreF [Marinilabiliaceae bacterium]
MKRAFLSLNTTCSEMKENLYKQNYASTILPFKNNYLSMKIFSFFVLFFALFPFGFYAQINPATDYPDLFKAVQMSGMFPDSKTFCDAIPKIEARKLNSRYRIKSEKPDFSLQHFVDSLFIIPDTISVTIRKEENVKIHIDKLWDELTVKTLTNEGSLIALPHPYVVPGGRFREMYYWDSYFTMIGLAQSGRKDLIKNMLDNFKFLIDTYGYIPNGNRSYYLTRSQPPFFSLMVKLYADITDKAAYNTYQSALEKEYAFWMRGKEELSMDVRAVERVVLIDGDVVLNRYWDSETTPRPEAYKEDMAVEAMAKRKTDDELLFRNIRAACESGWDFSSRWLEKIDDPSSIITTSIVPVDLNCLMHHLEKTLMHCYHLQGNTNDSVKFKTLAENRREAINKYFWNEAEYLYSDYNWETDEIRPVHTIVGIYPMFFGLATVDRARYSKSCLQRYFFKAGGLVTSKNQTGHQWDKPNGWAPLQYMAIRGLESYNFNQLAKEIRMRWVRFNQKVYEESGKLNEKYNVEDVVKPGGGGEYPGQDGFGWTNGVLLYFLNYD